MVVLPADHHIGDEAIWLAGMAAGAERAAAERGRTVVYGITPSEPHTGYGYVRFGPTVATVGDTAVYTVEGFREKPDRDTAQRYLNDGVYKWNSGCFAWRPDSLLDLVELHMPQLHDVLKSLCCALDAGSPTDATVDARARLDTALDELYPLAPAESVDYGILERATGIEGIALDAQWNDVGSWTALFDILQPEDGGNVIVGGDATLIECQDCLIWGQDQHIAAVGLKEMILVQSNGALLVCHRRDAQRVRQIVDELKKAGRTEYV